MSEVGGLDSYLLSLSNFFYILLHTCRVSVIFLTWAVIFNLHNVDASNCPLFGRRTVFVLYVCIVVRRTGSCRNYSNRDRHSPELTLPSRLAQKFVHTEDSHQYEKAYSHKRYVNLFCQDLGISGPLNEHASKYIVLYIVHWMFVFSN